MIKKIFIFICLITLLGCGYTPLAEYKKNNFHINKLDFDGDRIINNYLSISLKRYQNPQAETQPYDIKISSNYKKTITNKNRSGDPKNYKIEVEIKIDVVKENNEKTTKVFKRDRSLAANKKKITEKTKEKEYKNDLLDLIIKDIIFYLKNN